MLIGTREKKDFLTAKSLVSGNYVGSDSGVSVSDVRKIVYIIYGCGNVKAQYPPPLETSRVFLTGFFYHHIITLSSWTRLRAVKNLTSLSLGKGKLL
jgi:hypothetical protein